MNWNVGDKGIICGVPQGFYGCDINGSVVTVTSPVNEGGKICIEDVRCADGIASSILPKHLKPIPDNDSRQVTTWDECIFKPRELVTV